MDLSGRARKVFPQKDGVTTPGQDEGAATGCKAHIPRARNEANRDDRRPLLVYLSILGRGSFAFYVSMGYKTKLYCETQWGRKHALFGHIRESSTFG